jgi:hypothetical protein
MLVFIETVWQPAKGRDRHGSVLEDTVNIPLLAVLCCMCAMHVQRVEDGGRCIPAFETI